MKTTYRRSLAGRTIKPCAHALLGVGLALTPVLAAPTSNTQIRSESPLRSVEPSSQPIAATPAVSATNARQVLEQHFDRVQRVHARFQQRLLGPDGAVMETASGEMWLSRPGQFRWDYDKPYRQQIGSDGNSLWIYDEDLAQVTIRPVAEGLAHTPAALLSGQSALAEAFSIQPLGQRDGLNWLQLEPKAQDTDFQRIELGFDQDRLGMMALTDSLDQTTQIRFAEIERNPAIDTSRFELKVPRGVEVVGESGPAR